MKTELKKKDKTIKGFNIGNNSGKVAGQTIFHCHIHLIPRRKGDTDNPRGGVRGVIKDKQSYQEKKKKFLIQVHSLHTVGTQFFKNRFC